MKPGKGNLLATIVCLGARVRRCAQPRVFIWLRVYTPDHRRAVTIDHRSTYGRKSA